MIEKKHIAILGSTGSIGTQALDVIAANPDLLQAEVLTANKNADLLIEQALKHKPNETIVLLQCASSTLTPVAQLMAAWLHWQGQMDVQVCYPSWLLELEASWN